MLDLPGPLSHLWSWFWRLDQTRQGGMGPQALTYQEIAAWVALSGRMIQPWEVEVLIDMDLARRAALAPPDDGQESGLRRSVSAEDGAAALAMFDRFERRT